MRKHPGRWASIIVILGTGFGAYVKGRQWWEAHKPRPRVQVEERLVISKLHPPKLSTVKDGKSEPDRIEVGFSAATANLKDVNKPGAPGVKLSPEHPGVWAWTSDKQLFFTPTADWPPGKSFEVTLDPAVVPKEVHFKEPPKWSFTTPAFAAKWTSTTFYTDPKEPEIHQITADLNLSHPMKVEDVERLIHITPLGTPGMFNFGGKAPEKRFTVTEDKEGAQRHFWVRSARIVLPEKEDFVTLSFDQGATSTLGGPALATAVTDKTRVPDMMSGFHISGASTQLIRTSEGEPEQFLFLDTDGYAAPEELAKSVHAWYLAPDIAMKEDIPAWVDGVLSPAYAKVVKPVELKPVETEKDEAAPMATRHGFKFLNEKPGTLYIQVVKGTKALGGFILGRTFTANAEVPEFPKEVEILGSGGVLAINGERKISIKSRGVKNLRITLGRVPSSQVNHLARFNHGTFDEPELNYMIDEEHLAHFHREVVPVPARNEFQASFTTFDFTAALSREDKSDVDTSRGMYFVVMEGVEARSKDDDEASDPDPMIAKWKAVEGATHRRFILVTDLGLITKRNADGSRDIFVQSVGKGEPLAGVAITVLAKNGEFIAQAVTDAQGHAVVPNLEVFHREKEPVAVTARLGNDLAFMPFKRQDRKLELSRYDTEGVVAAQLQSLRAFVFTERGVYRPGDAIHVSSIVRRRDWGGELKGLPLEIKIFDAKGDEVKKGVVNLPPDGFLDWESSTEETDPTGVYEVTVSRILDEERREQLGRTAFRIEDFQPDRMKLSAKLNTAPNLAWIAPEKVKAMVKLETLFGTAAAKRRVTAKLDLSPASFAFDAYPDFAFHNRKAYEFKNNDEGETVAGKKVDLGELTTNDAGEAEFDLALERFGQGSFAMRFAAEGFEADGGRSVQAATSVMVSPMPYVVGFKPPSSLDYIGQDTPLALKFICVGPDLKPMAAPALNARIVRIRYVSVLTKQSNGNYEYVSTRREKTESEKPFTLPVTPTDFTLPSNVPGEYRLELYDGDALVSQCDFTIVGKGDPGRSLERDTELELKLARNEWNTGDSIGMNFNAPYTGAGLITIEREKVLSWQWFKSPATSVNASMPLPNGFEGTGYVSVAYVRALDSPEIFTSPLSYAVAPFTANKDAHKLGVTLEAPEKVKPGGKLSIKYSTAMPGRVVVFAVDEGIHQITNYKLPQPLTHFLEKRALETDTYQLLDLILPEFSLVAKNSAFGGDGDEALTVNLNPFKRKKDPPVVFWSGLVESGPEQREVTYDVPDYFDGRLKIMAVAVSALKLGSAETQSLVRGPMVLTPNVPTFVAPGDEFTVSLSVANNLEGANEVGLKLVPTEQIELLDPADSKLAVATGKEETTRFRMKARDNLGGAELVFTGSAGTETVTRRATLSVRPAAPYMTEVQSGYFRLSKQDVKIDRTVYPHFRKAEATVSALPLGLARGLEAYLADYPHGCSEQITSRAMSRLLLMAEADFGFDQAESASQIQSAFRLLTTRQNSDGGFGYWGGNASTDNLSVYVTHFLTEAKEASHALPAGLLEGALNRMKEIARMDKAPSALRAAAIYLLTRNGEVTTNFVLNLTDSLEKTQKDKWQGTLTGAYLAGTYALLQKRSDGEKIMRTWWSKVDKKPQVARWYYGWSEDPQALQAQGFALLCRHFPEIGKTLGYDDLLMITEPIRAGHFNTYTAAYGVLALKAYSQLVQQASVKLTIQGLPATGEPQVVLPEGTGLRRASFEPGLSGMRFLLDKNGSDLGAYYQVSESGYDKQASTKRVADGLEVFRELVDDKGKLITELKVGEVVTVRIRVRNNSPERLTNVSVLDLLPGGFLLAPNGLTAGTGTMPGADYVDVREDRAVFYLNLDKGGSATFEYGIKPVCAGKFSVPPVFAECMYDRGIKGRAGGGTVEVK